MVKQCDTVVKENAVVVRYRGEICHSALILQWSQFVLACMGFNMGMAVHLLWLMNSAVQKRTYSTCMKKVNHEAVAFNGFLLTASHFIG